MAGKKMNIKLKVLDKQYPMAILPELEEVYRIGEQELRRRLAELMANKIDGYTDLNYLAMVALDIAAENACLTSDREVSDDADRLIALAARIEERLK